MAHERDREKRLAPNRRRTPSGALLLVSFLAGYRGGDSVRGATASVDIPKTTTNSVNSVSFLLFL